MYFCYLGGDKVCSDIPEWFVYVELMRKTTDKSITIFQFGKSSIFIFYVAKHYGIHDVGLMPLLNKKCVTSLFCTDNGTAFTIVTTRNSHQKLHVCVF